jgi:hypothetical protein
MDQSGWRALEAAGIEVERRQVRAEVDVQPFAPGRLGVPHGVADQCGGDALPLMVAGDLAGRARHRTGPDGGPGWWRSAAPDNAGRDGIAAAARA